MKECMADKATVRDLEWELLRSVVMVKVRAEAKLWFAFCCHCLSIELKVRENLIDFISVFM